MSLTETKEEADHERHPESSPASHRRTGRVRSRKGLAGLRIPARRAGGRRRRGRCRSLNRASCYHRHALLQLLNRQGVAATVVHVLAERGALDYDTRIVEV